MPKSPDHPSPDHLRLASYNLHKCRGMTGPHAPERNLRVIAELDAVSLYEQLAATASNPDIKHRLHHVAKEEKTHVGEFQALLLMLDPEQKAELEHGMEEVMEDME